jgi:replicative DNA helicase
VLLENRSIHEAAVLLPGDFSLDSHQSIFRHMLELDDAGKPIDAITLSDSLTRVKALEAIGGVAYLATLMDGVPRRPSISNYVEMVKDISKRRQLMRVLDSTLTQLQEPFETTKDCFSYVEEALLRIEADSAQTEVKHVRAIGTRVLDNIIRVSNSQAGLIGLTTGIEVLDDETTGFRAGELVYIGGRPKQGKSSLMIQGAVANLKAGIPTAIFSLEMSEDDVLNRMYSIAGGVYYYKIRDPRLLSSLEKSRLIEAQATVAEWPLYITDKASLSSREISAHTRLLARRHGVKLAYVDYLQKIHEKSAKDPRQAATLSSERLRVAAKSEQVAVVVLSQLRRPERADPNAVPTMFELKESGAAEADAHLVALLYRPIDKQTRKPTNHDEIIIAAQRNGPTGSVEVSYDSSNLTFGARR